MGVHGLWKLIEPTGKPVPLETLENKVLAVDVSIWLHQAIKGFQDSKGAALPNAHLLGIYHRVCKLLYFKIKPVFVFDGGVPALKRETISKRNKLKSKNLQEANTIQKQILNTLLKHAAVSKVLSEKTKANLTKSTPEKDDGDNLFKLPPSQLSPSKTSSDEEDSFSSSYSSSCTSGSSPSKHWDMHNVDERSAQFRALPADVRHEILTDLKETRKQNSWGRLHELPTQSDDFSVYQMKRLLKRCSVQEALEAAEKEMGGHSLSLGELESLLNDHGVHTGGNRIASDDNTRYLYIKDVKKALEKARIEQIAEDSEVDIVQCGEVEAKPSTSKDSEEDLISDLEYQEDLQRAIQMSLQDAPSTSGGTGNVHRKEDTKGLEKLFSAAKGYMMEYSGLTPAGIAAIITGNATKNSNIQTPSEKLGDSILELIKECQNEDESIDMEKLANLKEADDKIDLMSDSDSADEFIEVNNSELRTSTDVQTLESHEAGSKLNLSEVASSPLDTSIDIQKVDDSASKHVQNEGISEKDATSTTNIVSKLNVNSQLITVAEGTTKNVEVAPIQVEIPENTNYVISDSDESDDFLEVATSDETITTTTTKAEKPIELEIIIQAKDEIEDDIFGDIFDTDVEQKKESNLIVIDSDIINENPLEMLKGTNAKKLNEINLDKLKDNNLEHIDIENIKDTNLKNSKETSLLSKIDKSLKSVRFENISNDNKSSNDKQFGTEQITVNNCSDTGVNDVLIIDEETGEQRAQIAIQEMIAPIRKDHTAEKNLNSEELRIIETNLQQEKRQLIGDRSKKERLAGNITDQMYQEAQELLQIFGVPYIVAPMEAEAQCAFLNEIDLTDGTITDDSDIWLFGGKTVYKNFFNQTKHVLEYRSENIQQHFKLSRQQLILLALLVGSDYTVGLPGIGPVTALEILAAFKPKRGGEELSLSYPQLMSGLVDFRNWFVNGRIAGPGRAALRTKLKNVEFSEHFPSLSVVRAYLEPEVETSREKFSWSRPDMVALVDYAKEKFGWNAKKSEDILKPVMKRFEEKKAQSSIRDYFKTKHKLLVGDLSDQMSKRVKRAVNKIGTTGEEFESEDNVVKNTFSKRDVVKGKVGRAKRVLVKKNDATLEGKPQNQTTKPRSRRRKLSTDIGVTENCKLKASKLEEDDFVTRDHINGDVRNYKEIEDKLEGNSKQIKTTSKTVNKQTGIIDKTGVTSALAKRKIGRPKKVNLNELKSKDVTTTSNVTDIQDTNLSTSTVEYKLASANLNKRASKNIVATTSSPIKAATNANTVSSDEDDDIKVLRNVQITSKSKVIEIEEAAKAALKDTKQKTAVHQRETIPQRLKDKADMMRNKMKAIEVFRRSKQGPGYVPKRARTIRKPKDDAELSESSSD